MQFMWLLAMENSFIFSDKYDCVFSKRSFRTMIPFLSVPSQMFPPLSVMHFTMSPSGMMLPGSVLHACVPVS